MQFAAPAPKRRKPSLTPMIDVVFLLLVFFMLASQFGLDQVIKLPLAAGTSSDGYSGPPRLVTLTSDAILLNGTPIALSNLPTALQNLSEKPDDPVVLRGQEEAHSQQVIDVLAALQQAGFTAVVLVE